MYEGDVEKIYQDKWRQEDTCYKAVVLPDKNLHGFLVYKYPAKRGGDENGRRETLLSMRQISVDAAFPVLHGKNGEEGTVQGVLELAGIPVVGCGTLSSAVCMDKGMAHRLAAEAGIKVPKFKTIIRSKVLKSMSLHVSAIVSQKKSRRQQK